MVAMASESKSEWHVIIEIEKQIEKASMLVSKDTSGGKQEKRNLKDR